MELAVERELTRKAISRRDREIERLKLLLRYYEAAEGYEPPQDLPPEFGKFAGQKRELILALLQTKGRLATYPFLLDCLYGLECDVKPQVLPVLLSTIKRTLPSSWELKKEWGKGCRLVRRN